MGSVVSVLLLFCECLSVLSLKVGMTAGKYTIIAQVIDGMDVLDKMEKIKVGKLCRSGQSNLRHTLRHGMCDIF